MGAGAAANHIPAIRLFNRIILDYSAQSLINAPISGFLLGNPQVPPVPLAKLMSESTLERETCFLGIVGDREVGLIFNAARQRGYLGARSLPVSTAGGSSETGRSTPVDK